MAMAAITDYIWNENPELSTALILLIITQIHKTGDAIILSLQVMKVKLREVDQLALDHAQVT